MRCETTQGTIKLAQLMATMYIKTKYMNTPVYEDLDIHGKVVNRLKCDEVIYSPGHLLDDSGNLMFYIQLKEDQGHGFIKRDDIKEFSRYGFNPADRVQNLDSQINQLQLLLSRVQRYLEDPEDVGKIEGIKKELEELRDSDLTTLYTN